jgi:hypothetical protein
VPKNKLARIFRYLTAVECGGLRARHPSVHGSVATRYEIIKISCQSWSSVDVMYVHPPHVIVLKRPVPATTFGKVEFGLEVRTYQRKTRANRGPEVMAIKIWKTERSG